MNKKFYEYTKNLKKRYNISEHALSELTKLNNKELYNFDVWKWAEGAETLNSYSDEEIRYIIHNECRINPLYFFREIVRIPSLYGLSPLDFTDGIISAILLKKYNNNYILEIPRQSGKSLLSKLMVLYKVYILISKLNIIVIGKSKQTYTYFCNDIKNIIKANAPVLVAITNLSIEELLSKIDISYVANTQFLLEEGITIELEDDTCVLLEDFEFLPSLTKDYKSSTSFLNKMLTIHGDLYGNSVFHPNNDNNSGVLMNQNCLDYLLPQVNKNNFNLLIEYPYEFNLLIKNINNIVRIVFGSTEEEFLNYKLSRYGLTEDCIKSEFLLQR